MRRALVATAYTLAVFVFLQLAYSQVRAQLPGAHDEWYPLLERLLFGLIVSGGSLLLFSGASSSVPAPFWWREDRRKAVGRALTCGVALALVAGLILFVLERSMEHLGVTPPNSRPALRAALAHGGPGVLLWHLFLTAGLTPFFEELAFRGAMQNFLARTGWAGSRAAVIPAILFALVHPAHAWPVLFGAGLIFGILFSRSGLVPAILAHAVYNAAFLCAAWIAG